MDDAHRFGVQAGNTLIQVSYKQSGHMGQYERWRYEERDPEGELVATIDEWDEVSVGAGWVRRGWRKNDASGNLIAENIEYPRGSQQT